jgi:hypothetical protein
MRIAGSGRARNIYLLVERAPQWLLLSGAALAALVNYFTIPTWLLGSYAIGGALSAVLVMLWLRYYYRVRWLMLWWILPVAALEPLRELFARSELEPVMLVVAIAVEATAAFLVLSALRGPLSRWLSR